MTDFSDEQIDQLLRDAEKRLLPAGSSSGSDQLPPPLTEPAHAVAGTSRDTSQKRKEEFRVRSVAVRGSDKPRKTEEANAGPSWFSLPKTNLTPELKRDLQLIRMRGSGVLDPKRHYKNNTTSSLVPQYSQVGTIIEGPTEFHSARLSRKERHNTLVDEVLAGERSGGNLNARYADVQIRKSSGRKAFYKKLVSQRTRGTR